MGFFVGVGVAFCFVVGVGVDVGDQVGKDICGGWGEIIFGCSKLDQEKLGI